MSLRMSETTARSLEIGKYTTAVAQRAGREGYFNPRTRETGSTLLGPMKSVDRSPNGFDGNLKIKDAYNITLSS